MSELQEFLQSQASEGEQESQGSFTLDLSKAADKLAAFALPSHSHYLLKMLQLAHLLRAPEFRVRIETHRTRVQFHAPLGGPITEPESIYQAFYDPLNIQDALLRELVSGLLGTIHRENLETLWSYSEGHSGQRLFLDQNRQFSLEGFTLSKPRDPELPRYTYTLSVLHPRNWKFWEAAKRRAHTAKLLESNCSFSGVNVWVDGRELANSPASILNHHLRETGYALTPQQTPAASVAFLLSPQGEPGFRLMRPSLSAYVIREKNLNLWATGTRVNNTLLPDGVSSMSWALQFIQDKHSLSMRFVPKRVPCRAILVNNRRTEAEKHPLRLLVFRHGLLVLEKTFEEDDPRFQALQGYILAFSDSELETDLTGLQVIENEAFEERVLSFVKWLPQISEYWERARPLLSPGPSAVVKG